MNQQSQQLPYQHPQLGGYRQRGTSSDHCHREELITFPIATVDQRQDLRSSTHAPKMVQEIFDHSEKIGASVRDGQSESQITANGGDYQNLSRLGGSVFGGGNTPSNISPIFQKKKTLGHLSNGLQIHFDDDNCTKDAHVGTANSGKYQNNFRGLTHFNQYDNYMKLNHIKPTPQLPPFSVIEKQRSLGNQTRQTQNQQQPQLAVSLPRTGFQIPFIQTQDLGTVQQNTPQLGPIQATNTLGPNQQPNFRQMQQRFQSMSTTVRKFCKKNFINVPSTDNEDYQQKRQSPQPGVELIQGDNGNEFQPMMILELGERIQQHSHTSARELRNKSVKSVYSNDSKYDTFIESASSGSVFDQQNPESVQLQPKQKKPSNVFLTVQLSFLNETCLLKDVKTKISRNQEKIMLEPIIQAIKLAGKPIQFKSIYYYSYRDKMDVFVGVDPIKESKAMPIQDLFQAGLKVNPQQPLTLKLKIRDTPQVNQSSSPLIVQQDSISSNYTQSFDPNQFKKVPQLYCDSPAIRNIKTKKKAQSKSSSSVQKISSRNMTQSKRLSVQENIGFLNPQPQKRLDQEIVLNESQSQDESPVEIIEDWEKKSPNKPIVINPSSIKISRLGRPPKNKAQVMMLGTLPQKDEADGENKLTPTRQSARRKQKLIQKQQQQEEELHKQQVLMTYNIQKQKTKPNNVKRSKKRAKRLVDEDGITSENSLSLKKQKRTKERTISDIIEKVSTWRKLYNGIMVPNEENNQDELQRWSLEDAATKVGVSKKSLDDYLLQLRFGKKFGFDFEANKDCKVGKLRLFVKQEKEKIKQLNGGQKISSKSINEEGEGSIAGVARLAGMVDVFNQGIYQEVNLTTNNEVPFDMRQMTNPQALMNPKMN